MRVKTFCCFFPNYEIDFFRSSRPEVFCRKGFLEISQSHSLLTHYKREKQSEVTSRPSEAGTDDIFNSNWEHFDQMEFLEATPETESSIKALEQEILTPPVAKRSRLSKESDATDPKAVLYTALANSLNTQTTHNCKPQDPLVERANLF